MPRADRPGSPTRVASFAAQDLECLLAGPPSRNAVSGDTFRFSWPRPPGRGALPTPHLTKSTPVLVAALCRSLRPRPPGRGALTIPHLTKSAPVLVAAMLRSSRPRPPRKGGTHHHHHHRYGTHTYQAFGFRASLGGRSTSVDGSGAWVTDPIRLTSTNSSLPDSVLTMRMPRSGAIAALPEDSPWLQEEGFVEQAENATLMMILSFCRATRCRRLRRRLRRPSRH